MVTTFEKSKDLRLLMLSDRLYSISYHWFGRSIMCAGEDCPACATRSPRSNFYFGALVKFGKGIDSVTVSPPTRQVCECPESMAHAIANAWEICGGGSAVGMSIVLTRHSTRDVWTAADQRRVDCQHRAMSDAELINQVAVMYRLPASKEHENFSTWLARVRVTQGPALASRCLFS
jgi:hypothetical protein